MEVQASQGNFVCIHTAVYYTMDHGAEYISDIIGNVITSSAPTLRVIHFLLQKGTWKEPFPESVGIKVTQSPNKSVYHQKRISLV